MSNQENQTTAPEGCTSDCSSCGENCPSRETADGFLEKAHPLSDVKKVIGVVSGKGGVGKSLVTSLLAVAMNRKSFNTGILDADITGPSIPKMFGVKEKAHGTEMGILPAKTKTGIELMSVNLLLPNETDPVVWRGPVIAGTVTQFWTQVIWREVDFLFVDMPPGTGDVALTVFQSLPVDGIIVVTSPQDLVSMIVEKAVNMARMMDIPVLGLIENMSYFECPDCREKHHIFGESHIGEIAKKFDIPVLGSIPINPKLAAAADEGMLELFDGAWLDDAEKLLEEMLPEGDEKS